MPFSPFTPISPIYHLPFTLPKVRLKGNFSRRSCRRSQRWSNEVDGKMPFWLMEKSNWERMWEISRNWIIFVFVFKASVNWIIVGSFSWQTQQKEREVKNQTQLQSDWIRNSIWNKIMNIPHNSIKWNVHSNLILPNCSTSFSIDIFIPVWCPRMFFFAFSFYFLRISSSERLLVIFILVEVKSVSISVNRKLHLRWQLFSKLEKENLNVTAGWEMSFAADTGVERRRWLLKFLQLAFLFAFCIWMSKSEKYENYFFFSSLRCRMAWAFVEIRSCKQP